LEDTHIEFTTIKEDFNDSMTENRLVLRVKLVLMDIVKDPIDQSKFSADLKDISHVIRPSNFDMSSLEVAELENVTDNDSIKELKFFPIKTTTNIYEIKNAIIIVFLKATSIKQTNKKDKKDTPILRFNSEAIINVINKPI
jgi:hypothetical protein